MTRISHPKRPPSLPAAPDLAAAAAAWLAHLAGERRLSERTIEAYERDARQFLAFLGERVGAPPKSAHFTACAPAISSAKAGKRRRRSAPFALRRPRDACRGR